MSLDKNRPNVEEVKYKCLYCDAYFEKDVVLCPKCGRRVIYVV